MQIVFLAEDYKGLVEKREIIRNEFHDRMVETSQVCTGCLMENFVLCSIPFPKILCSSRKYPTPIPSGNCSLASYFASKILAFKSPLPLEISDDFP